MARLGTVRLLVGLLGAAVLSALSAAVVTAHVELISSSPAAGANLSSPPDGVTIAFDDELDPDLSSFTATGAGSVEVGTGEVDLTVADRNVLAGAVTITEPGIYTAMAVPGQGATLPFFASLSVAGAVILLRRIMEAR